MSDWHDVKNVRFQKLCELVMIRCSSEAICEILKQILIYFEKQKSFIPNKYIWFKHRSVSK